MWVKKIHGIEAKGAHFYCAIRDMHELEVENMVLEEIYDNYFDAILLIDQDGVIQISNKTAEIQFGWTRKELVGKNVHELIANEKHAANHDKYVKRYVQNGDRAYFMGARRYRIPMKRKDGTVFLAALYLKEFCATEKNGSKKKLFGGFIRDQTPDVENE